MLEEHKKKMRYNSGTQNNPNSMGGNEELIRWVVMKQIEVITL